MIKIIFALMTISVIIGFSATQFKAIDDAITALQIANLILIFVVGLNLGRSLK